MNILNDLVRSYEQAGLNLNDALIDEARVIFWMLALMSAVWSWILLASGRGHQSLLTHTGRQLLFFGFFGGLFLESFPEYIGQIPNFFHDAGSAAVGGDTFLNPDQIVSAGFGLSMRLLVAGSNFPLADLGLGIRAFGALVMMISFVVIAIKVTQVLIEQYVAVLGIGVFLFAFTGARWTWSVGEALIRYAVHIGIRLLLLVAVFDVGKSLITQMSQALESPFAFISFRVWVQVVVTSVAFAYVTWTVPDKAASHLSQRIQFANPHSP